MACIKTIRNIYMDCLNSNPKLKQELEYIMKENEINYIIKNLHNSFELFSNDNIMITNPTYNILNTNNDEYDTESLDLAYSIMAKKIKKIDNNTNIINDEIITIKNHEDLKSKYNDIVLPFGIYRKKDLLTYIKYNKKKKLNCLDFKIMKLTLSLINKLKLTDFEKKLLTNKIKYLRKLCNY